MHHKHATRTLLVSLWLPLSVGLAPFSWAEPYADAMAALAGGDHRAAYRVFKRLASRDHPEAQYRLGMLYLLGEGVEMDAVQGIEWLKQAAQNGSYLAANELGQIYLSGRGVTLDEHEAVKWVKLATRLAEENPGEADEGCE